MRADPRRARLALHLVLAALLAGASAPGAAQERAPERPTRIVVGSKNFPESHLLGEILARLIQARTGLEVEHESGLGGTLVCHAALVQGEIDLYPEYTGTGWAAVLEEEGLIESPLRAFLHVQARYRELFDLEWLQPFGLNNTYALAMREDRARELGIKTVSDLVPHAGELRAGFSSEFMNRPDGYPGLVEHYGLELASARGMEHALAYEAIDAGSIDLVDAYSTDGKLLRYGLRPLVDDRGFFPPYNAAPVVRAETLRAVPELRGVLERLAFRISDERMLALNHRVEVGGEGFGAVARSFLEEEGLLAPDAQSAPAPGRPEGFLAFLASRRGVTLRLVAEHLWLTGLAVLFATVLAVPLGIAATRSRLIERLGLGSAAVVQTIPSLALLAFLIAVPGLGLSQRSAVFALTLYAVLPILRNTFAGLHGVDPELVDAARGMGLTERQVLLRIQLPLATRTILAGVRTATVITVGFATLAAFIGAGGLGQPIVTGLYLNDVHLILAGALPAALLALAADRLLGLVERRLTPRGLRTDAE